MCLGIPMQVVEPGYPQAVCEGADGRQAVDTSLVGPLEAGRWVMVFLGAAREVITADAARQSADALEALRRVMAGDTDVDHLFADLINREPELPEFLRDPASPSVKSSS